MTMIDKLGGELSLLGFYVLPDNRPTSEYPLGRWDLAIAFQNIEEMQVLMGGLASADEVILAILPEIGIAVLGLSQGTVVAAAASSDLINCPLDREFWEEVAGCVGMAEGKVYTRRLPFTKRVIGGEDPMAWRVRLLFGRPSPKVEISLGASITTLN